MAKSIAVTGKTFEKCELQIIGTAPILVGHPLPWDIGSYWDNQPAEVSQNKVKRPTAEQLKLLEQITGNGYSLKVQPYNNVRGVDGYQEAILRGHWLPDHAPAFPVAGLVGAISAGAVQYGGKNYGMAATKLRSLLVAGDPSNKALIRIETDSVSFQEDIGRNSDMKKSPRHIIRLCYGMPWKAAVTITYNPALLTQSKVVQAVSWAGDWGIGQRRPSSPHGGQFGTFRLA